MAIKRQDEVLAKAAATDATVIPRYDIKRPDGTKVAENVALELKNTVVNEGTAIDKNLLDELLAASGTAGGTASALTLAQDGFVLADGALVRCKITEDLAPNAALDVNGTGAKYLYTSTGEKFAAGIKAGVWLILIYSSTLDGYVIVNKTNSLKVKTEIFTTSGQWKCPTGVTSVHVFVHGGGGGGGKGSNSGGGGGGGGSGKMKSQTVSVTPGNTYSITIGAAVHLVATAVLAALAAAAVVDTTALAALVAPAVMAVMAAMAALALAPAITAARVYLSLALEMALRALAALAVLPVAAEEEAAAVTVATAEMVEIAAAAVVTAAATATMDAAARAATATMAAAPADTTVAPEPPV